MCNAEAAQTQEAAEGDRPAAATREVLKLEKKLREMRKIEDRVNAGEHVDPLQRQKLGRKAEVEAELVEAMKLASCDSTTVASQDGCASDGFQEAVERAHVDDVVQRQWDEPIREQWREACPGWQQAAAVSGQAAMAGGLAPMVFYQGGGACGGWVPQAPMAQLGMGQVLVMVQPATPQAASAAGPRQAGAALPHGGAPLPAQQRQRGGRNRTGERAAGVQQDNCQRLLEALEGGGAARENALASLVGEVRRLAMDSAGCRVVQRALEVADYAAAAELVQDLHGHVRDLIRSPHGNYVAQKMVEVLAPGQADFVARELRGCAAEVARHRFGCRVVIRLVEFCADTLANAERAALVEELLEEVGGLCSHPFGHHVIKAIVEHAHPAHQQRVFAFLCVGAADKAEDRYHSYVIEAALGTSEVEQVEALALALVGSTQASVLSLSETRYGFNVLRALLRRPGTASQKACEVLRTASHRLRQIPGGQRLLRDAGLVA